jgi:hypothetical protein
VKAALLAGWERISLQNQKKKKRQREGDGCLVWATYIQRGIRLEKCYIIAGEGENIRIRGLWFPLADFRLLFIIWRWFMCCTIISRRGRA